MDNVVSLDEQRPHIALKGAKSVHVISVKTIENVISGKIDIATLDPDLIRDIFADWLTQVQDND